MEIGGDDLGAYRSDYGHQPVDLRVLGPLELAMFGRLVKIGGPRQQKALALLAANANSVVSNDRLVDELWDIPPDTARQQVYNVISALRQILKPAASALVLEARDVGYLLRASETSIDMFRFHDELRKSTAAEMAGDVPGAVTALRRALRLWRGPAFEGLDSKYLESAAVALDEERLAILDRLFTLRLGREAPSGLVVDLCRLVAEHPFHEPFRAHLMDAYCLSGRPAEAISVYEDGRRLLAEELGLDPGKRLRAAHERILRDEGRQRSSMPDHTETGEPARLAEAVPSQRFLPHDVADFTGRNDEVRQLLGSLQVPMVTAVAISAVDGMGGVGKTSLAVHVAHLIADEFPDGQYFIDLHGFSSDSEPVAPLRALHQLLLNTGMPLEFIPGDLDSCTALWRSRLAGKRAVLILDNARNAEHVRALLPGVAGVLVFVTSRRRLSSLDGAMSLSLDTLGVDDSIRLFTGIIGSDRAAAEAEAVVSAVELCGHLPLAIRIAAARLRDRKGWTVARLVSELRDQRRRRRLLSDDDRDVMAVIAASYRHLIPMKRRVFRLLALHPGPSFDVYAAAAICDLPVVDTLHWLEDLVDDNLLLQRTAERYEFHDLVRDCARELLDQGEDEADLRDARQRMLDFYLLSAHAWCAPIARGVFRFEPEVSGSSISIRQLEPGSKLTELIEAEYQNLVAAADLATATESYSHSWQITCAMQPYFSLMNYRGEAESLFRNALNSATAVGQDAGVIASLTGLSCCEMAKGDKTAARKLIMQAIDLATCGADRAGEVQLRTTLGLMYLNDIMLEEATAGFLAAHEVAESIGDNIAVASLVNNLGAVSFWRGRFDEALGHYERALYLDEETGRNVSRPLKLANIGQIHLLQGRLVQAGTHYRESMEICRELGIPFTEAMARIGLCAVARTLRDFERSLDDGRRALELARSVDLRDMEFQALGALCDTYVSIGDLQAADEVSGLARDLAAKLGSARYIAQSKEGQAHVLFAKGHIKAARKNWHAVWSLGPGHVVDMSGPVAHLSATGSRQGVCWRCRFAG